MLFLESWPLAYGESLLRTVLLESLPVAMPLPARFGGGIPYLLSSSFRKVARPEGEEMKNLG